MEQDLLYWKLKCIALYKKLGEPYLTRNLENYNISTIKVIYYNLLISLEKQKLIEFYLDIIKEITSGMIDELFTRESINNPHNFEVFSLSYKKYIFWILLRKCSKIHDFLQSDRSTTVILSNIIFDQQLIIKFYEVYLFFEHTKQNCNVFVGICEYLFLHEYQKTNILPKGFMDILQHYDNYDTISDYKVFTKTKYPKSARKT